MRKHIFQWILLWLYDWFEEKEDKESLEEIPKNLPLFIFSGDAELVGKNGKGVEKLFNTYKKNSLENVTMKLYLGGRDEILNETNQYEVMKDVTDWIHHCMR